MNHAHPRATVAAANVLTAERLTYQSSPCAGVAAPAPSIAAHPDHLLVLACLVDKSLLCVTHYEELRRWLPGWSVGRLYRTLHALEAQGLLVHSRLGWRADEKALRRLRSYEARVGVPVVPSIHAAIAAAETKKAAPALTRTARGENREA